MPADCITYFKTKLKIQDIQTIGLYWRKRHKFKMYTKLIFLYTSRI